jgi:uncharacterized protein
MPELFPVLRSMVDSHKVNSRFILLGSTSPDLIRDSSESLAGRIVYKELYSYHANVKKRLVKSPKIYIRDTGILHHLLNVPDYPSLTSNPVIGSSWEGYVIEQIGHKLTRDTEMYFYRTHEGSECDLVLARGGQPLLAIEIKYASAPKISRGLTMAFRDIQAPVNFIITPGSEDYLIREDIRVCSLITFLQKYLP